MEIGKYIDFHKNKDDTSDYCYRLTANDNGILIGSGPISCPIIITTNLGTGVPDTSTPGYGTAGALYFRTIS